MLREIMFVIAIFILCSVSFVFGALWNNLFNKYGGENMRIDLKVLKIIALINPDMTVQELIKALQHN